MAQYYSTGSYNDLEDVTKDDLNRYTDKIDNVLDQVVGRRLFRNFMNTAGVNDGVKCLDLWVKCAQVINSPVASSIDMQICEEELYKFIKLINDASGVQSLDFAIMRKLTIARETEAKHEIIAIIDQLRIELANALRSDYELFQNHFVIKCI